MSTTEELDRSTLSCSVCGSPDWIAVDPGQNSEFANAPLLFALSHGRPTLVWCSSCWPWLRRMSVTEMTAQRQAMDVAE